VLALATPSAAWAETTLTAPERGEPLAILYAVPTGEVGKLETSEVVRTLSSAVRQHTSYLPEFAEPDLMRSCEGRLGCIVERVSGGRTRGEAPHVHLVLVLSNLTKTGSPDRITATLVDADQVRAEGEGVDNAEREERIRSRAVRAGPIRTELRSAEEAQAFFERLVKSDLRSVFEQNGAFEPWGEIALQCETPGLPIQLDGATLGMTQGGDLKIVRVVAGMRTLTIGGKGTFEREVDVGRGKTVPVEASIKLGGYSQLRSALLWGGAGVAALGAAALIFAVARHDGAAETYCFRPCTGGNAFETLGYDPSVADPTKPINPSGVLLAPLGYSLIAAGGAWALGSALGDDDRAPWIELTVGVVLGALAYGLSAALNPNPH
jgi:hypothetical protein